jgi:hypothetical protein
VVEQALVPAAGLDEGMLLSVLSDVKSGDFSVRMPLSRPCAAEGLSAWLSDSPYRTPAGVRPVPAG